MNPAAYHAALADALKESPAAAEGRRANLEQFLQAGFPTTAREEWRYTDLSALADQAFTLARPEAVAALDRFQLPQADPIVFVNGRRHGADVTTAPMLAPEPDDSLAHLTAAFALQGLALRVPARTVLPRPVQVLGIAVPAASPSMFHVVHSIHLEAGADATVVFHDVAAGAGSYFTSLHVSIDLAEGARCRVVRVQDHGAEAYALSHWRARLGRDAALDWVNLDVGGALVRNDLDVTLAAPGATISLAGVYAPGGKTHVDNHTTIVHGAPHTTSRQSYRGIVADRARAVFNGRIVVQPGAVKTDSQQQVANLLLSPHAEVYAKPELEIYADDVKCAHGATCGQLDEQAIFYLRSRGLDRESARALLLHAFADEVLQQIAFMPAQALAQKLLATRLP